MCNRICKSYKFLSGPIVMRCSVLISEHVVCNPIAIFFNLYMKTFVSFQYSDRSTPVLLIVSLAGIKVCSPDGKVSINNVHRHDFTITLVRK